MTTDQTLVALIIAVGALCAIVAGAFVLAHPRLGQALMVAVTVGIGVVMFLRTS
ncbi:hypothetical protein ACGFMM_25185 [Streptomyces sp. NPDC048604]|uniref:hypothetical protein n=1 Tax=Streptomyces sp. NPDC048604 TaxID=3365578 RepID=UPI00371BE918